MNEKLNSTQRYGKMNLKSGFTLVELAIVVVIVGVIIGGVIGGQSLIESSERGALISEARQYEQAIMAFKLEYDELPGIFSEAQDYWGATYTAIDGSSYSVQNGSSTVLSMIFSCSVPWQHMGLAEIIPTLYAYNYCNVSGSGGGGISRPAAATGQTHAWDLSDNSDFFDQSRLGRAGPVYNKNYSLYLSVSTKTLSSLHSYDSRGVVSAKFARAIDKKIDDDNPARGSFFAIKGYELADTAYQNGCVNQEPTASSSTTVSYDLSSSEKSCRPMFFIDISK